jgi:hypothetical protein
MKYYQINFSPPWALFLTVGAMYGLPLLKHCGLLDAIKDRMKRKGKNIDDKIEDLKKNTKEFIAPCDKCGGENVLVINKDSIAQLQCIKCQNIKPLKLPGEK